MTFQGNAQVLIANVQKQTMGFLQKLFAELDCYRLILVQDHGEVLDDSSEKYHPALIIVDSQSAVEQAAEWVQLLKMTYPVPLIVIHGPDYPIDFSLFKKNGADRLIHFHYDREFIIDLILELAPPHFSNRIPLAALSPISFDELHPEMETNFNVYAHLPGNQKTILLGRSGSYLDPRLLKKTKDSKQNLYFLKTETKQFLEYARTAISMHNSEDAVAMTEKLLRSKNMIFNIMSEFFNTQGNDFEAGKKILERCRKILTAYELLEKRTPEKAFARIAMLSGQARSFYQDAIAVSNYSSLIGQILGKSEEEIETLALAGLLHNIGLSFVPEYLPGDDWTLLPQEAKERFKKYPEKSVFMVKTQRVPLPPDVTQAILQHQELPNGTGFPSRLKSFQICEEAKIVNLALRIQDLTGLIGNKPRMTFKSAIDLISTEVKEGFSPHDLILTMNVLNLAKAL